MQMGTRTFRLSRVVLDALGRRAARQKRSSTAQLEVELQAALAPEIAEIASEGKR
jgi:hypothetical protein